MWRDLPPVVYRLERSQELVRLSESRRGWRVEPAELIPVGDPPIREFEGERCEIGLEDLRCVVWGQAPVLRLGPESVAGPRPLPTRPSPPLVRGRTGDHDRLEAVHPRSGREARDPHHPTIDYSPDPIDREARLCDRGRQNHLPHPWRRRLECPVLLRTREAAMEGEDEDLSVISIECLV